MAEDNVTVSTNSELVVNNDEQNNQVQNGTNQNNQEVPPAQGTNVWGIIKTLGVRMFFIYIIASLFRRSPPANPTQDGGGAAQIPSTNVFHANMKMDMYVYITEQEEFTDFKNEQSLFWQKKGLTYGDWNSGPNGDGSFTKFGQIHASEAVQNNGSLYIHVYFVKSGKSPDPEDKGKYSRKTTTYRSKRLNRYKKRHFHNTVNLLTGQTDVHPDLIKKENSSSYEILSHWHPNLTLNLLDDHSPWIQGSIPQPLDEYIEFLPGLNKYYPVIFFNEYWNLNTEFTPVNDTTKVLNLTLTYSPISLFRWQLYAAQGMRNKWYSFLGSDMEESDDDQDALKTAFLETNPYLLALTIVVSIAHSIFEFLAFKNDIQFWKSRKSLEGLSVRSIFFNVFQSLIVVLYVLDNETNTVVRISVFIGLLIEIWKIKKVVDVKIDMENKWFGILPRLRIEDKSSYTQSQTKQYDLLAFKYLSWLLFPLLVSYSVYSLLYNEHRGWYSFILSMMYGFLLTFGFIMMTPQLFINYKLKSVAHLPWRMLTYKALNTFIDDIFAFVIKMPTLYRIGCLRDDVIFFIYVYQRYIYRVDPKRVNEFGTSQEMVEQNGSAGGGDQMAIKDKSTDEMVENVEEKPEQEKKED
ncbi:cleft lip and palate transmembrane protein 1 homolog [Gigantopelta aegis]|uniref:cleft lip and palate transmembrane protein 1 homolog n=1 Tax=Gigantopelta aegis TaxID=1735272 RepID=UPI001B88D325|nr:cleft lip and palate transmembrane protein 1 homolog [Gigantopelta aegis]